MDKDQAKGIAEKFALGNYTEAEHEAFFQWLLSLPLAESRSLIEDYSEIFETLPMVPARRELWEKIYQRLGEQEAVFGSDRPQQTAVVRRMPIVRRFAVAAAIACGLLVGGYWLVTKYIKNEKPTIVQTAHPTDIPAPATNRAMITLGNGQHVYLDSVGNGTLARQGNTQVVKLANGQVAYKIDNIINKEMLFNTLSNPRGSQVVTLTLSDGSKVWLNAESSIRYPVIFAGQDRIVEITGEGYFEVKKNANQPFKVLIADKEEVDVLGTSFDINAYTDERSIKTTLLDGSVRVGSLVGVNTNTDKLSVVLKPGQQAQLVSSVVGVNTNNTNHTNNDIRVMNNADTAAVMAWKNGLFSFAHTDLHTLLRQLARWYDIDVHYEDKVPEERFSGRLDRSLTLDQMLHILTNHKIHYTIESNRQLTIRP